MLFVYIVVEQVEPIIVAVVQQLVEFALCGLEKSITNGDGLNFQVCDWYLSWIDCVNEGSFSYEMVLEANKN